MNSNSVKIRFLIPFILFVYVVLLFQPVSSQLQSKVYEVPSISVDIEVCGDGTLLISENITIRYVYGSFTFFERWIPLWGLDYIELLSVDANGVDVTSVRTFYTLSRLTLTIYYRDVLGPREATFMLRYRVYGGLISPSSLQNSVDWNAVGSDWEVPIGLVNVVVRIPGNVVGSNLFSVSPDPVEVSYSNGYTSVLFTYRNLPARTGYRVVVLFPKIYEPKTDNLSILKNYPVESALTIVTLSTLVMLVFWFFRGRMPKTDFEIGSASLLAQPLNLSPLEVSYLLNRGLSYEAALSEIFELARRGFIDIEYDGEKRNTYFKPSSRTDDVLGNFERYGLKPFEVEILRLAVSSGDVKKFIALFDDVRVDVESKVEAELTRMGYFKSGFKRKRMLTIYICGAAFIATLIIGFHVFNSPPPNPWLFSLYKALYPLTIGFGLSFIPVGIIYLHLFTPYTVDGAKAYRYWKEYLNSLVNVKESEIEKIVKEASGLRLIESYLPYVLLYNSFYVTTWLNRWSIPVTRFYRYSPSWLHVKGYESIQLDFPSFISALNSSIESMLGVIQSRVSTATGGGPFIGGGFGGRGGLGGGGGRVG
jgi:hypothetical protein